MIQRVILILLSSIGVTFLIMSQWWLLEQCYVFSNSQSPLTWFFIGKELGLIVVIFMVTATLTSLMKRFLVVFFVAIATTILIAPVWWYLWMYHGFVGSPFPMAKFLGTDGESSYDAQMTGMTIMVFIITIVLGSAFFIIHLRKERNAQYSS